MKYMTADLFARLQSADETILDAADEEWGRRCEAYRERLKEIHSDLPPGVASMLRYRLHDARVLTVTTDEEGSLSVFLDLGETEDPRDKNIELRYKLVPDQGPGYTFVRHPELADHGKPYQRWLYDEIDVAAPGGKTLVHSILLTGGAELQLTFSRLICSRLNYLVPPIIAEKEAGLVRTGA